MYIYIYIYTSVLLSISIDIEVCNQAVLLHLEVRPGVLHEYVAFAARPGVHMESTWSSLGGHLPRLGSTSPR